MNYNLKMAIYDKYKNQKEFAGEIGMHEASLSNIVNEKVTPHPNTMKKIAQKLNVNIEELWDLE